MRGTRPRASRPGAPGYARVVEASAPGAVKPAASPAEGTQGQPTAGQITFDVAFGIVLPIACLVADPGIFRGDGMLGPMLGAHAAAAYALIVPAMAVLAAWLAARRGALLLAGPLLVSGVAALGIGVLLLPLSVPGIFIGIGLLGLVPFGTAATFLRNGVRALRAARTGRSPVLAHGAVALLGLVTLALPLAAQSLVDHRTRALVRAVQGGDPDAEAEAVARLKPFGWVADRRILTAAWERSGDSWTLQGRLARAWHEATGRELRPSD